MPLRDVVRRGCILVSFSMLTVSCSLLGFEDAETEDAVPAEIESEAVEVAEASSERAVEAEYLSEGEEEADGAFDPAPVLGLPQGRRASKMKSRGEYLVKAVATCASCHLTAGEAKDTEALGGGRRMKDRFGEVFAANISPDSETGIGDWGIGEISRAIRASIDRDGNPLSVDAHQGYRWMSDYDANSIAVYLLSQKTVSNSVPRRTLGGFERRQWGMFTQHRDIVGYVPMPPEKQVPQYGQYLAAHVASCGRCHSPVDAAGAESAFSGRRDEGYSNIFVALRQLGGVFSPSPELDESERLEIESLLSEEGVRLFRKQYLPGKVESTDDARRNADAPSLRSKDSVKLSQWSVDDFVHYLSSGPKAESSDASESEDTEPGCPWPHYSKMAESDKRAIAMFLKRL